MLTVQLIMQSGKPLVMKLPISATTYELKTEIQSLLNIQPETLKLSVSDVTLADLDLIVEVTALGGNESVRPIMSCYDGNNFVGQIMVEHVLVDSQSSSDSSFETVSSDSSQLSLSETKRFKKDLKSSEESVQSPSYGCMKEACGMGGCGIKARPRPVKSEIEMEPYVINGQRPPFVNILPENRQFVVVVSSSECEKPFCDLLEEFFGFVLDYRNVRCLNFNEVTPVTEYDGRLFIAAADEDTMEWVERNVCAMESYGAVSLINFLHLTVARVKWPKVENCLERIFTLLERQNSDINTEKWAVVEIWMDADSVDIIKQRCNRLKLSFWMIVFEFCD
ncbi:uncharacterized protein Dwil_GK27334 [Drosophila willistoni]|uniref:DUF4780 domain-containing protein n=1 Tax=Drosophila willistoni TaxID=7260 RepID=A0A0Q9WWC4_DROWI|nr:uncharacterized protein Dwil_GK27334 [Drosophila willistoni]